MHDVSKPNFGDKNKKKYFKMSSAFTCGAGCLMSVGRVVWGLVLCGANCLEANKVVYCLILLISMVIYKLCQIEENQPFDCTSRNKDDSRES